MILRKAKEHEVRAVAKLYDDVIDYLEANKNYPGWRKGIYPTFADASADFSKGTLYVLVEDSNDSDDEIIQGSVVLNHLPEKGYDQGKWLKDVDYSDIWIIRRLVVTPASIGRGVADTLLKEMDLLAKNEGIKSLRLDVYEINAPAIALYERNGYRYAGTVDIGLAMIGLEWFKLFEKVVTY